MSRDLLFSVSIKDCEVQHFRVGGKGGQKVNKTSSGARVIHHPSGARGESREERSQPQNTKTAFLRLVKTAAFRVWLNREIVARSGGKTAEQRVEEDMRPENIRVELRTPAGWTVES